jgi:uncharacterized protein (TIGR02145 family)
MAILCKLGIHRWSHEDCNYCPDCGNTRNDGHIWEGCVCEKCGKRKDENHTWDLNICTKCGLPANIKKEEHVFSVLEQIDDEKIEEFILKGVNVETKRTNGFSLLHNAVYGNKPKQTEILLQYGADVNAKDDEGRSPLHLAVLYGQIDIVKILLKNDADINAKTNIGETPLKLANSQEVKDSLEEFREKTGTLSYKKGMDLFQKQVTKNVNAIMIGRQIWSAENLDVSFFLNGDPIPEAIDEEEWKSSGNSGKPAWCNYMNNPSYGEKYGKLYNWHAVNDPRGLAPEGWHIPSQEEFEVLKKAVQNNGNNLKASGEGSEGGKGTDSSGFKALLGGRRYNSGFGDLGTHTNFWCTTESSINFAMNLLLYYRDKSTYITDDEKYHGFYVRCIKDLDSGWK